MRANIIPVAVLLSVLALQTGPGLAHGQSPNERPILGLPPEPAPVQPPAGPGEQGGQGQGKPNEADGKLPMPRKADQPTPLSLPVPEHGERGLAINLATALRLADARPLLIEAARAAVETEYGLYEQARALWLPTVYLGVDYQTHAGGAQNFQTGQLIVNGRQQFLAGAGAVAVFALTDAIYGPLAARQLVQARNLEVQTAKNDALLSVAEAYFNVLQARGILAGTQDAVAKARDLERRIAALGKGLAPAIEVERVRTTLADLEQQAETVGQDWRTSSATLTRVLRLDPAAVVMPMEQPHVQVTLISPKDPVDALIPVGLTSRPELATQQAVVQATLVRLRQEKMRPLIPSLALQTNAAPNETLGVGVFGTGRGSLNQWAGRSDWDAQVVWEFQNLGFGNRGRVTQRRGEQKQALVELFRIQDQVAAEVAQAHAQVKAAAVRVQRAEVALKAALESYQGNLRGLSETVRAGELLQLVNRPQEAVAALQQLQQAYINYFTTTGDYNRAQFRLYRAMGYPAQSLACGGSLGPVVPVNSSRPPQMAPVHAPEPCANCPR